jgi:beta-1,4-mannosyl-glycoprotein beta-1,4-N-acetylglucosaminyltransferase
MKPRVFDCFPFAGTPTELLLLECRFDELYRAVDAFVVVEATVDHQDHPKDLRWPANADRYEQWADKVVYVVADRLPTLDEDPGPWGREHAQREWITEGLRALDVHPDDIVLQSDLDEIPKALYARNVKPRGLERIAFRQRGHFWAVDWVYPHPWRGTVAGRAESLGKWDADGVFVPYPGAFAAMRDQRNFATPVTPGDASHGWHFSWLGGVDAARTKVRSFCHPEVEERIVRDPELFWREGIHVDGLKMFPSEVDGTYPRWMQNPKNVPANWYRPQ